MKRKEINSVMNALEIAERFTGTKAEVVKQIGNAVPPVFAEKLLSSYLVG